MRRDGGVSNVFVWIAVSLVLMVLQNYSNKLHPGLESGPPRKALRQRICGSIVSARKLNSRIRHAVGLSSPQEKRRSRTKRQTVVESCTEENCVEGTCSEDKTKCICSHGFSGDQCQYDINECQSAPCQNGARCIDGVNRYYCDCEDGWTGDDCSEDIDECISSPCYGRGECLTPRIAMFMCRCNPGFYGINCENDIEECMSHPCENGGFCIEWRNRYFCKCQDGFNGTNCEEEIDECLSNPCKNGGICIDQANGFQCQCLDGYLGAECEEKVDKCVGIVCENGGQCVEGIGRAYCRCTQGFEGDYCERETDECISLPCQNSGTCLDMESDYACICNDGFDGRNCEMNINECRSQPCENNGNCMDEVNGYFCVCESGFIGDHCEVSVDECTSDPCLNGGECRDQNIGFLCICPLGFTGELCSIQVNKCLSFPCQHAGTCHDEPTRFRCECVAGYEGELCEIDFNECASIPCNNGGRCVDLPNGYICECGAGYNGDRCEVEVDECESNPCRNRGTCIDGHHSFTCICAEWYQGIICETPVKLCQPSPCLNGGKCTESRDAPGFQCECLNGYDGDRCQNDVDDCRAVTCQHGGICIDGIDSYYCLCRDGYQGMNCNDTSIADAQNRSRTLMSVIPAAGILVLCLLAILMTVACLRRQNLHADVGQDTSNGFQHSIIADQGNAANGKLTRSPKVDLGNEQPKSKDDKKVRKAARNKHSDNATKSKSSKAHRLGKPADNPKRISKGKNKVRVKHEIREKRKKDTDVRRKKGKSHEDKMARHKEVDGSEDTHKRRESKKRPIIKTSPNNSQNGVGIVNPVYEGSIRLNPEKSTAGNMVTAAMASSPPTNANHNIRNLGKAHEKEKRIESNRVKKPEISSPLLNKKIINGQEHGTLSCKENIRLEGPSAFKGGKPPKAKRVEDDRNEDRKDNPNLSSLNSPIYVPVKTANGVSLYLQLGRLDRCPANKSTNAQTRDAFAHGVMKPVNIASTSDADSPRLRFSAIRTPSGESPMQLDLSSPWQPVWKYNFPHLLMEDTQLERPIHNNEDGSGALKSKTRTRLSNPSAEDTSSLKGSSQLQKTFLKEEISMLIKTREHWQSCCNETTACPDDSYKPSAAPDQALSYSRHFTPPSHQETSLEHDDIVTGQYPERASNASPKRRLSYMENPEGLMKARSNDLWEREERKRVAVDVDGAWEDSVDGDHRQFDSMKVTSHGVMNDFGLRNPHGMSRENAFVNQQL